MNFTKNIAIEQQKGIILGNLGDRAGCFDHNFSDLKSVLVDLSNYYHQYFRHHSDCFSNIEDSNIEDIDASNLLFFSQFSYFSPIYLDFLPSDDIFINGTACLFWDVTTPVQNGLHQSIFWCIPRSFSYYSYGRGDDGIYNKLKTCSKLKTIMTVFGGVVNSPIANFLFRVFFYYLLVIIVLVISDLYLSQISFFNFLPLSLASAGGIAV